MVEVRKKHYHMYYLALRLLVLIQLSSCSAERVFSKLTEIRDADAVGVRCWRTSMRFGSFCSVMPKKYECPDKISGHSSAPEIGSNRAFGAVPCRHIPTQG
eukprot:scaffold5234_cov112-Skeletonema_dohrnii-CCMP3373.AAC.3